jgi:hypothetical protein
LGSYTLKQLGSKWNTRDMEDKEKWSDSMRKPDSGESTMGVTQPSRSGLGAAIHESPHSLTASAGAYVADRHDQVAQCLRCLQLATVSWVGLPGLGSFGYGNGMDSPPWAVMRPYTIKNWLNGQIQHHFVSSPAAGDKFLSIAKYSSKTDPAKEKNLHERWFVRQLPMTGKVKERAMQWPKIDVPTYENWLYWHSVS